MTHQLTNLLALTEHLSLELLGHTWPANVDGCGIGDLKRQGWRGADLGDL